MIITYPWDSSHETHGPHTATGRYHMYIDLEAVGYSAVGAVMTDDMIGKVTVVIQ